MADQEPQVRVQRAAALRLDEIFRYIRDRWGQAQAERYINGLFEAAAGITTHATPLRPIPAEFGIAGGYFFRCERHFVYCRVLGNGDAGIVTVLHEKMHQIGRFHDDFFGSR